MLEHWQKQENILTTVQQTPRVYLNRSYIHYMYSIGVNSRGINSLTNCTLWKRILFPTALFAYEGCGPITSREKQMIDVSQRYFTRFMLRFFKRGPSDTCNSNVGLWSVEGYTDKKDYCFLVDFARSTYTHIQMFNLRLSKVLTDECSKLSITFEFLQLLRKCDLTLFLENCLSYGFLAIKILWKKIVNQIIDIFLVKNSGNVLWSALMI